MNVASALTWVLIEAIELSLERLPGLSTEDAASEAADLIGLCDHAMSLGADANRLAPYRAAMVEAGE